jgi:hypothetical protein
MEEAREKELESRLRGKFYNSSASLISAAIAVYCEIVKRQRQQSMRRSIRLTAEQFAIIKQDFELFRKCVIFLLASDMIQNKKVPLLCDMWYVPEPGEVRGWVRVKIRLPSKPPPNAG